MPKITIGGKYKVLQVLTPKDSRYAGYVFTCTAYLLGKRATYQRCWGKFEAFPEAGEVDLTDGVKVRSVHLNCHCRVWPFPHKRGKQCLPER